MYVPHKGKKFKLRPAPVKIQRDAAVRKRGGTPETVQQRRGNISDVNDPHRLR